MPRFAADCWFITGPTAVGKSEIALRLAEQANAEIIALDSMTIYRGMDIGTAKPNLADRQRVPHHLIDRLEPHESACVDWFLREAEIAVAEIRGRGRQPLFVGGTPLYLKAALRGLFDGPPANPVLRSRLEAEAGKIGSVALHQRLAAVDQKAASKIHVNDLRRIVRALEVYETTGKPIGEWQQEFDKPADPLPKVACLTRSREDLYQRINDRVFEMLEAGWIEEVMRLHIESAVLGREAAQAVGYLEIAEHLAGRTTRDAMIELIQRRTRHFAKHQMTWFRHIEECRMVDVSQTSVTEAVEGIGKFFCSST